MSKYTEKAKKIATTAHEGQFYGTGNPYVYHCNQVAEMAENLGYCDEVVAACYLHDTIEDTYVSESDLLSEFPISVVEAVIAVTYQGTDYIEKIKRAMTNPIGHVVKFCDSSCNYANTCIYGPRPGANYAELITRRASYISKLSQTLPTPAEINSYLSSIALKV